MKKKYKVEEVTILYRRPHVSLMPKITSSGDVEKIFRENADLNRIDHKEFFWVMLLNRSNSVLGISQIGVGNSSGVSVNVKEIFQLGIKANASSLIVCHNHPSGNLNPSQTDIQITKQIVKIGNLMSIPLLDHIIITSEDFYSLADQGLL